MAPSFDNPNGRPQREILVPTPTVPRRDSHRSPRRDAIPAQPSLKQHTIRLLVATAIGIALMLGLLMLAVQYLNRDWARKQRLAAAGPAKSKPVAPAEKKSAVDTPVPGWTHVWSPQATERQLRRMAADRRVPNWWAVLARSLAEKPNPDLLVSALFMAMASHGETAGIKNDLGAVYLQQGRLPEAVDQFRAADQIQPGFAPARFNHALYALASRNPGRAVQYLGQYLGQRPADGAALRLQANLLAQSGQARLGLDMLETFLADQPREQPLFLEAAVLAARVGNTGSALRYLETALNGNSIQTVVRTYQSPVFRSIRLSGAGDALAARMAEKARAAFGAPLPATEVQPLRATVPDAKVR